jgi:hypothetical protein
MTPLLKVNLTAIPYITGTSRCEGREGKSQIAKVFWQILNIDINILQNFFAFLAAFAVKNVFAVDSIMQEAVG